MKTKITLITTAVALLAAVSISAAVAGPSKATRASVGVSHPRSGASSSTDAATRSTCSDWTEAG